jgi:hypothetical protein
LPSSYLIDARDCKMKENAVIRNGVGRDRIVALAARVDRMLQVANSDRRKVMSRKTLVALLKVIISGKELAWARSGYTTFGYGNGPSATFALCARSGPTQLCVAISTGPEKVGSPGRVWPQLKPWRPNTSKTADKLKRWIATQSTELIRLSLKEANAVARELAKLPPPKTRWHHLETSGNEVIVVNLLAKTDLTMVRG